MLMLQLQATQFLQSIAFKISSKVTDTALSLTAAYLLQFIIRNLYSLFELGFLHGSYE